LEKLKRECVEKTMRRHCDKTVPTFNVTLALGVFRYFSGSAPRLSSVDPQTDYARCKILVERGVSKLADGDVVPMFLRNATAFGASPRMRFDIVPNNLAGLA
jgi:hypothetical protein